MLVLDCSTEHRALVLVQQYGLRTSGVNTAAAAVEAARCGWAVFPCPPGDKRPAVPDWERRACADPDRVGRYWPSAQHNVGLACGPSRLVVVDLDTHSPLPDDWRLPGVRDGRDVLALLAEWAGQPWPVTYTVSDPDRRPAPVLHRAGRPGDPQQRRARSARSSTSGAAAGTCWPRARCSTSAPTRATRSAASSSPAAGRTSSPTTAAPSRSPHGLPPSRRTLRPLRAGRAGGPRTPLWCPAAGPCRHRRAGREGDRNGPLYWAARRAAEMIAAGEIDRGTAEELLVAAALEAGLRGGEREARRTFASAMRGGGL